MNLNDIEERFCHVTRYLGDLSHYPLLKSEGFDTDKDKSRDFAEVFTPPHIVDKMLDSIPKLKGSSRNLDLCAGHGQFTIRMLRKFSQVKSFNISKYLRTKNFFAELQLESCYKLLWVFGTGINLAIGDALQLKLLPRNWKGIWLYLEKVGIWVNITTIVKAEVNLILKASIVMFPYDGEEEKKFISMIDGLKNWLNKTKGSKMELKRLMDIPAGRELLKEWVRKVATDVEDNWQDVKTPEWVAREMVRCIPDLKTRSKFLVLFNIEILAALVKEGVSVSRITFGSDSALEQVLAKGLYKRLKTIGIGNSFDEMKKALEGCVGQYDVVLSNPPYQVQDGGHGASAKPIYHEIVMYVIDELKPKYVCMITPSRWMAGGKGLNDYRARMLNDKRLSKIVDFPGKGIFKTVSIQGGVSYFLWERDRDPREALCDFNGIPRNIEEYDVLVRNNTSVQILKKVLAKHAGKFCNDIVLPRKPFGLATNFKDWISASTPGAVKCYCAVKDGGSHFVDPNTYQDSNRVQGQWKVCVGRATHEGSSFKGGARKVIAKMFIAEKGSICIETYIVTGYFNTKKEAENYADYMGTRFYRFMLSLRVISQDINREKFAWVPDLGNYTNPVTDEDLYAHFNLTKKEIEHIESTIKEIS